MIIKKLSGTVVTDDIDLTGDKFPMKTIETMNFVGKKLLMDFKPETILGEVTKQAILGNGLEIEVVITEDGYPLKLFEGKGVGLMGLVTKSHMEEETLVVDEIEITGVSIVSLPCHQDWKVNKVWSQQASELKEGVGFSDEDN